MAHLMVRGPLVWVRGIHAPLTATPNTGSKPVLFLVCVFSFLIFVLLLTPTTCYI